jgi:hypothetical protein
MKKINNVVIENQSPEFAVELKRFWEKMNEKGLIQQYIGFDYINTKEALKDFRYYGIANHIFSCLNRNLAEKLQCQIFDHIPTDAELGLEEDVEFPCEMEVKVWDADIFTKRIVVAKFNDDGKDYFIAKNPSALTGFSIHTTAKPIRTEQLTISELLTIASEVKGVQVTLKEDKA